MYLTSLQLPPTHWPLTTFPMILSYFNISLVELSNARLANRVPFSHST